MIDAGVRIQQTLARIAARERQIRLERAGTAAPRTSVVTVAPRPSAAVKGGNRVMNAEDRDIQVRVRKFTAGMNAKSPQQRRKDAAALATHLANMSAGERRASQKLTQRVIDVCRAADPDSRSARQPRGVTFAPRAQSAEAMWDTVLARAGRGGATRTTSPELPSIEAAAADPAGAGWDRVIGKAWARRLDLRAQLPAPRPSSVADAWDIAFKRILHDDRHHG